MIGRGDVFDAHHFGDAGCWRRGRQPDTDSAEAAVGSGEAGADRAEHRAVEHTAAAGPTAAGAAATGPAAAVAADPGAGSREGSREVVQGFSHAEVAELADALA